MGSELKLYCDRYRHLVCVPYSVKNLHRMAQELGLKRHWYHPGDKPHYDIPITREAEIMGLCEVVSAQTIVDIIKKKQ